MCLNLAQVLNYDGSVQIRNSVGSCSRFRVAHLLVAVARCDSVRERLAFGFTPPDTAILHGAGAGTQLCHRVSVAALNSLTNADQIRKLSLSRLVLI